MQYFLLLVEFVFLLDKNIYNLCNLLMFMVLRKTSYKKHGKSIVCVRKDFAFEEKQGYWFLAFVVELFAIGEQPSTCTTKPRTHNHNNFRTKTCALNLKVAREPTKFVTKDQFSNEEAQ